MLTGNKDVDRKILNKLEDNDLVKVCQVNKQANTLCNDQVFWMNRVFNRFGYVPGDILRKYKGDRSWSEYYIQDLRKINPSNAQGYLQVGAEHGRLDQVIIALKIGGNIRSDYDYALRTAKKKEYLDIVKYLTDEKPKLIEAKEQLINKDGKYYNFWKGEISGQLSDGTWENEPYIPGMSNFTEALNYISDRLLFLGAAHRVGLNIKDDPWIERISWMFNNFKNKNIIEYIKTHDLDKTLNTYLDKMKVKGNKFWIENAQKMINNKQKIKLIWDYIKSGKYDYDTLYNDLDELNTFYIQYHLYMYGWNL